MRSALLTARYSLWMGCTLWIQGKEGMHSTKPSWWVWMSFPRQYLASHSHTALLILLSNPTWQSQILRSSIIIITTITIILRSPALCNRRVPAGDDGALGKSSGMALAPRRPSQQCACTVLCSTGTYRRTLRDHVRCAPKPGKPSWLRAISSHFGCESSMLCMVHMYAVVGDTDR